MFYQVHGFDAATPIEETLRALDTLVAHGHDLTNFLQPRAVEIHCRKIQKMVEQARINVADRHVSREIDEVGDVGLALQHGPRAAPAALPPLAHG